MINEHEHNHAHEHHEHHHDHAHEFQQPCDVGEHEHHHHDDGSCCCHHHEVEFHGVSKVFTARLIIAVVLYIVAEAVPMSEALEAVFMVAAGLVAGYDVIYGAFKNLFGGRFFDEYFLMTVAAIAACIIGEFEEGAAVMVLYRIGQSCQDYAIHHSRKRVYELTGEYPPSTGCGGKTESMIRAFSRVYTPVVLILAVLIAVCMPLIVRGVAFSDSVYRALNLLVIACPCSIVISVPMAYFAGIAAASRQGIFFHDSTAVDAISKNELSLHDHGDHIEGDGLLIMTDRGSAEQAKRIADGARKIALQNVIFVVAVKVLVMILSFLGISALWFAVFADSGVTVIAVINALRAFRTK